MRPLGTGQHPDWPAGCGRLPAASGRCEHTDLSVKLVCWVAGIQKRGDLKKQNKKERGSFLSCSVEN